MFRHPLTRSSAGRSLIELILVVGLIAILLGLTLSGAHKAHQAYTRTEQSAGRPRPNIVIILTDDQGYHDVGFHGLQGIPTPHMDSLARDGVRCSAGYVTCSVCSPSRAGLLTGRYQTRFGHENLPPPNNPQAGLPVGEITLASLLRDAGYHTAVIGKWHLGVNPTLFHPNLRGFDRFFGFLDAQHDYINYGGPDPIQRNGQPVPQGGFLTYALTNQAVSFIHRHADEPFFLYLTYNSVHVPNQAPQDYLDLFPNISDPLRRGYAARLSSMDDGIGLVLDTLRQLHLDRDTLVFFLTDNGGPLTMLGPNGADNTPLGGEKNTLYEGGIRVPFVVRWKGRLPHGTVYDHPVISLDIFATALAAARVHPPSDRVYDGVNLLPHLRGEERGRPHEMLFWRQYGGQNLAVRGPRYKLVRNNNGPLQLFDLQHDIGESNDLAGQLPNEMTRLQQAYAGWEAQMIPPLW
jgi:arylsulfatase A-like enzyme